MLLLLAKSACAMIRLCHSLQHYLGQLVFLPRCKLPTVARTNRLRLRQPRYRDLSRERLMTIDPNTLAENFRKVAELCGINLSSGEVDVESLPAPHCPPTRLPRGKMAVYVFCHQAHTLKVGKAGPNSGARYTSQHYNPDSAGSTLAASLLRGGDSIGIQGITKATVGDWIKNNTNRYNFLLDSNHPDRLLTLLEASLQCRLDPVFEGSRGQR